MSSKKISNEQFNTLNQRVDRIEACIQKISSRVCYEMPSTPQNNKNREKKFSCSCFVGSETYWLKNYIFSYIVNKKFEL